ncbi:hypothetical protein BSL78_03807 [Apostichopus japonicus]|uniref:Uncharacterized protein n=1 Tax=Stichopus japonicus TaxID=307972 RepID=A0A2G8LGC6_STIJA|nr:hypothetical protein BSL78_03807 [Apostichopus japonicus]
MPSLAPRTPVIARACQGGWVSPVMHHVKKVTMVTHAVVNASVRMVVVATTLPVDVLVVLVGLVAIVTSDVLMVCMERIAYRLVVVPKMPPAILSMEVVPAGVEGEVFTATRLAWQVTMATIARALAAVNMEIHATQYLVDVFAPMVGQDLHVYVNVHQEGQGCIVKKTARLEHLEVLVPYDVIAYMEYVTPKMDIVAVCLVGMATTAQNIARKVLMDTIVVAYVTAKMVERVIQREGTAFVQTVGLVSSANIHANLVTMGNIAGQSVSVRMLVFVTMSPAYVEVKVVIVLFTYGETNANTLVSASTAEFAKNREENVNVSMATLGTCVNSNYHQLKMKHIRITFRMKGVNSFN